MIHNLYAKYLLADRLNKMAADAGLDVAFIEIDDRDGGFRRDVHLQITQRANPDTTRRLLDRMPDLDVRLSEQLLHLEGVSRNGLTFDFYLGHVSHEDRAEIEELVSR